MDRASLTADEMPCAVERKAALKCSEPHQQKDKKKFCQDLFDDYTECKKKYVEERNARNYAASGGSVSKTPWSQ